jgi:PadR family transcriptional regulator PadR
MPGGNSNFMSGVPELMILRLLQDREMYGYEIVQAIRLKTNEQISLGEGVVYPALHGLEKNGALRALRRQVGGRSRVYYTLTSKGLRRLFDLTDRWDGLNTAIQAVLRGNAMPDRLGGLLES